MGSRFKLFCSFPGKKKREYFQNLNFTRSLKLTLTVYFIFRDLCDQLFVLLLFFAIWKYEWECITFGK